MIRAALLGVFVVLASSCGERAPDGRPFRCTLPSGVVVASVRVDVLYGFWTIDGADGRRWYATGNVVCEVAP